MNDFYGNNNNENNSGDSSNNNNMGGYDNSSNNNGGGYGNNNMNGYNNGGYNNNNMGGYNNNGYNNNNMGGYNNGGYSNGGGYYPDGQFAGMYNDQNYNQPDERKGKGFAIASFVLALVNIVPCCTMLSIITVPLCIIFSLISLVGKRKGTAFAIIGLVLALLSGIIFGYYGYIAYKVFPDLIYFSENQEELIDEYEKTGEIPERFEKYTDPKYDRYWKNMGYGSFEEFYAAFIKQQKEATENASSSYSSSRSRSYSDTDLAMGLAPALLI